VDIRRRKPVELVVDDRLKVFTLTDWAQPGDGGRWQPAWLRWREARAAWVAANPGSNALGDGATRIGVEVRTQLATMRAEWNATHRPNDFPTADWG
jgi:hypothetical protein